MKRLIGFLLALLLAAPAAFAQLPTGSFTHPEIGEFLSVFYVEGMPRFSIYDYPYYEILDPGASYRGMEPGYRDRVEETSLSPEEVLTKVFLNSIEGETMFYTGINAQYAAVLNELALENRVKAILLLNGFEGAQGYRQLSDLAGFDAKEMQRLGESYQDYQVKIRDKVYPFRLLAMFFAGPDFQERYSFIKTEQGWRLLFITKEYTDDYMARGSYIHGFTGSEFQDIEEKKTETLLGTAFGMEEAQAAEAVRVFLGRETIDLQDGTISDAVIFRLPAQADFTFDSQGLSGIRYTFQGAEAYYSAFISLYTRFFDPVSIGADNRMCWSLNDVAYELIYDEVAPVLQIAPVRAD